MSYSPNNQYTYTAAMAGAMSGLAVEGRPITSGVQATYAPQAEAAQAFAQEFDTQWGDVAPDAFQFAMMQEACTGYWRDRPKFSATPTDYSTECAAIIAAILEGSAELSGTGFDPPAYPPGASSGTPARNFANRTGGALGLTAAPQVAVQTTVTPEVSGVFSVRVTGVAQNGDSAAGSHPVVVAITDSLGHTLETQAAMHVGNTSNGSATGTLAFVIETDKATGTPVANYPLGTPVTFNASITGDGSGELSIPTNGAQIEVVELLA